MSTAPFATASQVKARLAGLFYAITIAAGLFAEVGVRASFRGEDALTIAGNGALYRLGEVADIIMLCSYLVVTTLLYELLAPGGRQLSLLAAAFSLTGITMLASNAVLHMAPVVLVERSGSGQGALCFDRCDAAIVTLLDLHGTVYGISLIFFGVYCVLIGWLAIRSRSLPSAVGIAMMVGGASHLATKVAGVLEPDLAISKLVSVLPLMGEVTLAVWLLLFGIQASALTPRAGPASPPAI